LIIGIGHRSEHGKDTVANFILEWFEENHPEISIKKLSWAWKLKDVCYQLYSWTGLQKPEFYETEEGRKLRNTTLASIGLTPVELWIKFGTNVGREVYPDTWVNWVKYNQTTHITICPDTRFLNETETADYLIKVFDPRKPNREGLSVDDVLADFQGWDTQILNVGTLEDLRINVYRLCKSELYPRCITNLKNV
jgi:hypothetical protein